MKVIYTETTLNYMLSHGMQERVNEILNKGEHRNRKNKDGALVNYIILKE